MEAIFALVLLFGSIALAGWCVLQGAAFSWDRFSRRFTETADNNLKKVYLFADSGKLLAGYIVAAVALFSAVWWFTQSFFFVLMAAALWMWAPRVVYRRLAERRRKQINDALPNALSQIAGAMRAGSTFVNAIQTMVDESRGPIAQEFALVLREQRMGARLEDALENLGERVQTEEMDLTISAANIAQDVGGNLAEILQRLSDTIRRKMEMEGKVRALTAQGVLQGRVMTGLPFVMLMALLYLETQAIQPIFTGILGWCFLAAMVCLQLMGGLMIRKIVSIDI